MNYLRNQQLNLWLIGSLIQKKKQTYQVSSLLSQAKEVQRQLQNSSAKRITKKSNPRTRARHLSKKRLITSLNTQIQDYSSTVHRLSIALEEITSFKQDTARVLGDKYSSKEHSILALQEELISLKADNAKKTAELDSMGSFALDLKMTYIMLD